MLTCKKCKESFDTFKRVRVHSGEKPYKCDICEKRFSQPRQWRNHKQTHTGEKPFKCFICNSNFSSLSYLTKHERIHSDVKPLKCGFCSKTFRFATQKKVHERMEHNRPKIKCSWNGCKSEFNDHTSLKDHIRITHDPTPFHCDQCNRKYKFKKELDHYKRKHQIVKTRKMLASK